MKVTLNVHNLTNNIDLNHIATNAYNQYCGKLTSSEMSIADDSLEKDMKYGITHTHVFERIGVLHILDEYQREKSKSKVLDNFWNGKVFNNSL